MIKPVYADKLYKGDFEQLARQIGACYTNELGPGDLPTKRNNPQLKAIIVPHHNYELSGPCMAWAYKEIAEATFPKRFILLFPDTTGTHFDYATTEEDFETILGVVQTDKEFIQKLLSKGIVKKTDSIKEHSIEVQLPFLQYSNKDKIKEIKIIPIICPTTTNYQELAEQILEISKDFTIICATNLTSYGIKYAYTPFKFNIKDSIKRIDKEALNYVLNYQPEELLRFANRTKTTISGTKPLTLAIEILKQLNAKPEVVCYYNSTKIIEDENQISFTSVIFS